MARSRELFRWNKFRNVILRVFFFYVGGLEPRKTGLEEEGGREEEEEPKINSTSQEETGKGVR